MPDATSMTDVIDRIENADPLDAVSKRIGKVIRAGLRSQKLKDALHGVWLGHPLHPMLSDVPIGMWTAAAVLDVMPGTGPAAATLIATGCAASVPTAVAGWADWSDLHEQQQRVGLVHAAANGVAIGLFLASLAARASGSTLRGKAYSYAGMAVAGVGGYLGGHLAFRQAAGVNHAESVPHLFPSGWQRLGALSDLPDGSLVQRTVADIALVVLRRGEHVDVLADECSHLSAPLSEGEFIAEGGHGCVVCPWHASTFRLTDGAVVHGPATSPMPAFQTRVTGDEVEIMLPGAG
jgi:nitrite reductase/ring-hydroxylating ferredoxin subunit/uncharacterized membrane protein